MRFALGACALGAVALSTASGAGDVPVNVLPTLLTVVGIACFGRLVRKLLS